MKTTLLSVDIAEQSNSSDLSGNFDREKIVQGVKLVLEGLGADVFRQGILATPERVADMYLELCSDMNKDPSQEISFITTENTEELIVVKDIHFSSICEHHLIPFIGVVHLGYIPNAGVITGLSKLARVVESAARRLQVQERMTAQIAEAIMEKLLPKGVIVIVEAEHLCMSIRGVNKPGAKTITTATKGNLQSDQNLKAEALRLIL